MVIKTRWWRCRELNPGPTCSTDTYTVMSFSFPALLGERQRKRRGMMPEVVSVWHRVRSRLADNVISAYARMGGVTRFQKGKLTRMPERTRTKEQNFLRSELPCSHVLRRGLQGLQVVVATSGYREPLPSRTEEVAYQNHAVEACHPQSLNRDNLKT